MGSPITLSGFNQIDFSVILDAIMTQERRPVSLLALQQTTLEAQKRAFGTLASKLGTLQSAVDNLAGLDTLKTTTATVSDATRISVSSDPAAPSGSYEIFVDRLARAQVTTSVEAADDRDTTKVAGAGTLRFTTSAGSVDVTLAGDVTLDQLASAINSEDASPVSASIIRNTSGRYQLMLTGRETGLDNAFTVDTSAFTAPSGGGSVLTFTTPQAARDASIRVNGVTTTSSSNTFDGVINGLSFTALREDAENPVTVLITANFDSVVGLVQKLAAAFNDTAGWIADQAKSKAGASDTSIGRDPFVRSLRSQLSKAITGDYSSAGGFGALAEIGFEFTRTGTLTVNETKLREALASSPDQVEKLFRGSDGTGGVFGTLATTVDEYTKAGGLVPNAQDRLTAQLTQLSTRIADMEERLATRRLSLQKEFAAADAAIAQLNNQKGALSSLGSQYSLF